MTIRGIGLTVLGMALAVVGGLSGNAHAQSWAGGEAHEKALTALYEEAVAAGETQVVTYGAYTISYKPLWDIFSKRFPKIAVVGNPISAAQLLAKIQAEITSGQRMVDVMTSGITDQLVASAQGHTEKYQPPNAKDALAPEYIDPNGHFLLTFAGLVGIVHNLDKMPAKDLPRTLRDLLDPKYKGMVIDDPLSGALTTLSWTELLHAGKIDGAWMKAIRPNLTVVPTTAPYFANITTGSIAMMPFQTFNRYVRLKESGARVGFVDTPGLATPVLSGMSVVKGAPHPKAARLLMAWFITPEAQNALGPLGASYPVARGATVPKDWPSYKDITAAVPITPITEYAKARTALEQALRANFK